MPSNSITITLHNLVDKTESLCDDIRLYIPPGARSDVRVIAWVKQELRALPGSLTYVEAPGLRRRLVGAILPKMIALVDFILVSPVDPIRAKLDAAIPLAMAWCSYVADLIEISSPARSHAVR